MQTFLQFVVFVSALDIWNAFLGNMKKLHFQLLKSYLKYGNVFSLKPAFLYDSTTGVSLSTFLWQSWFVAQIYIFACSLSSLSQLWRNYYLCSIWFFMDFTEIVSSLTVHSWDWSTAQKCTKDISGELPLALWGVLLHTWSSPSDEYKLLCIWAWCGKRSYLVQLWPAVPYSCGY